LTLQLLTHELQALCPVIVNNFLNRCRVDVKQEHCSLHEHYQHDCTTCELHNIGWKQSIENNSCLKGYWRYENWMTSGEHQRVKWNRINGNDDFMCTVCNQNLSCSPQPGAIAQYGKECQAVEVQEGDQPPTQKQKGKWENVCIRKETKTGSKNIERAKVIFPVPQLGCIHQGRQPTISRLTYEKYNFFLCDGLDLLKAFIPDLCVKDFKHDWKEQDASNLLSFIEATCPPLQRDASYIRDIRNSWAHQQSIQDPKKQLEFIANFALRLSRAADRPLVGYWEKVRSFASMRVGT